MPVHSQLLTLEFSYAVIIILTANAIILQVFHELHFMAITYSLGTLSTDDEWDDDDE